MSKIYKGQTKLTFLFETETDLTGVASVEVEYKNPAGVQGSYPATISNIVKGTVSFVVTNASQTTPSGDWIYWIKANYTSGEVMFGEPYKFTIYEKGM